MRRARRPRDTNQLAKLIVDLATGQADETYDKDPAAVRRGILGGPAGGTSKACMMTKKERSEFGRKMAQARWKDRSRSDE